LSSNLAFRQFAYPLQTLFVNRFCQALRLYGRMISLFLAMQSLAASAHRLDKTDDQNSGLTEDKSWGIVVQNLTQQLGTDLALEPVRRKARGRGRGGQKSGKQLAPKSDQQSTKVKSCTECMKALDGCTGEDPVTRLHFMQVCCQEYQFEQFKKFEQRMKILTEMQLETKCLPSWIKNNTCGRVQCECDMVGGIESVMKQAGDAQRVCRIGFTPKEVGQRLAFQMCETCRANGVSACVEMCESCKTVISCRSLVLKGTERQVSNTLNAMYYASGLI